MIAALSLLLLALLVAVPPAKAASPFDDQLAKFSVAALGGHDPEARAILRQPGFLRGTDSQGHTALFAAACAGNLQILELVLASPDVDPNRVDVRGASPLFYAASGGHTPVVRILLEHGADPSRATADGKTPLMAAVLVGQDAVAELLVAHGAQLDAVDATGASALFYAAQEDRLTLAKLLLEHHAKADQPRRDGLTPLDIARSRQHDKVASLLRDEMLAKVASTPSTAH